MKKLLFILSLGLLSINSFAQIVAQDDNMPFTNGQIGSSNLGNILSNNGNGADTLNGSPVTTPMVIITVVTPAIPIGGASVPSVNPTTGVITIPAGTPASTYTITYQICEVANATNCDTAVVTIGVFASPIDAVNDGIYTVNGFIGNSNFGNVFINDNLNGLPIQGFQITFSIVVGATPLSFNAPVPIINSNGSITVPPGTPNGPYQITYQICEILNPTNCDTATLSINVVDNNSIYNGIGVFVYPLNNIVPGFSYQNVITIINFGTQAVPSGTLTFTKDGVLTLTNITPNTGITSALNGFTYDYTNLLPGENRQLVVTFSVPPIPTVNLGQMITNSAIITPSDSFPTDNSASLTQAIIGAYDPNDKTENHGGQIVHSTFSSNDFLTYTIRFENIGTANALNIRVEDLIDTKLDENSFRMIGSSNNYILTRNNNNIIWLFNNINLPPSVPNTQIGHGYITFQIKPKTGYAIGDIIPNFAEIYFDFNPAIVTNVCNTEFVATLGNESFAFSDLSYYPNPVKNSLTISNENLIDSVEISSVLGQKMLSQKVNGLQTEIDLSELSSGIYFVKMISEGQEKTVKIVKE